MGTILPNTAQMTLSFEPGIASRHLSLRDCMVQQVYQRGHGRVAAALDMAPSKLTEKLAGIDSGGKPRGMSLDEFERYLEKTGDATPIYYLLDKFLRDPRVTQQEALSKLADLAETLPALLAAAGLGITQVRARRRTP